MPYFRYDDYASLVTELKSKRRVISIRNKTIRKLANLLRECRDELCHDNPIRTEIKKELEKLAKINLFELENKDEKT